MRGALVVFIGLNILSGLSIAHAIANRTDREVPESQELFANVPHTRSETSNSSADRPHSGYQSQDRDCEGKSPSTSHVTTLLSKFALPSTNMHGVQCPIPPVQGRPREEESHP